MVMVTRSTLLLGVSDHVIVGRRVTSLAQAVQLQTPAEIG